MRNALLIRFILVLLAALSINSIIFYAASGNMLLGTSRQDMLYAAKLLDCAMGDWGDEADYEAHVGMLAQVTESHNSRLTIIGRDGTVRFDTQAEPASLDNHLDRSEVREALETGSGYSIRRSGTLNRPMLYVAYCSEEKNRVIRMAAPYGGIREYLPMLLPAAITSFLAALLCSMGVTGRFVSSITKPLRDIAGEMEKVKGDYAKLEFAPCPYPEIQVIADTTMKLSQNVGEYLSRLEKERNIRQEFFSNASHELKTPITSIQGYAELLESGMARDSGLVKDFAGRIKREAVNMTGLINDILMISRLESEEADVVISDVRLALVLEDVLESVKPLAASLQVFLHWDCRPVRIRANGQQMRELLANLISNAVKYNRPGGQVWIAIKEDKKNAVISVRDNGVGIPTDSLERIFERFYRVDKGRSRKQGGTGLGLAIVKHVVNYYHGTVQVTSRPEEGSEFVVTLPLDYEEASAHPPVRDGD